MKCERDLWEYLRGSDKKVVMYGMGNGADKILLACAQKGITVSDFFASDGFVRGHSFHGKRVCSWSEIKERYGADRVVVLLSFGSSRPEVLETIARIAEETELYAPDVPAFGDGLFDRAFYEAHREELGAARALLADEESRRIFDGVLQFKLTGRIDCLRAAENDAAEVLHSLVRPAELRVSADLGAYNGDTVRQLLDAGAPLDTVIAMEPDARNFRKLQAYAEQETRADVEAVRAGAWSSCGEICFDGSGNRNASMGDNRSPSLEHRPYQSVTVPVLTPDHVLQGRRVDYIKYDVEGSEREALMGSVQTIRSCLPTLLVSLYHRNEDLFALPLLIHRMFPDYKGFYLRRMPGIPAWDLNLYVRRDLL